MVLWLVGVVLVVGSTTRVVPICIRRGCFNSACFGCIFALLILRQQQNIKLLVLRTFILEQLLGSQATALQSKVLLMRTQHTSQKHTGEQSRQQQERP